MNRTILQGDVLEKLVEINDSSIDCIISSPPYWGLRDYGVSGQLGLEPDFRDYLSTMNDIMIQLKRVLKNTGTCWINFGDTYGHNSGKSRYGIPERFYINCIDDGWIARNHIPWYKSNSMPSSVKDRFTNKWESIFFFAKQQKYYFNLDAVREKTLTESKPFNIRVRDAKNGYLQQKFGEKYKASEKEIENYDDDHITKKTRKILNVGGQSPQGIHRNRNDGKDDWEDRKWSSVDGQSTQTIANTHSGNYNMETGELINNPKGKNPGDVFFIDEETTLKLKDHYDNNGNCLGCGKHFTKHAVSKRAQGSENRDERQKVDYVWCNARGKNPGDVFFINPKPFPEAHFATFPIELPTKILKCACPTHICKKCGKVKEMVTQRQTPPENVFTNTVKTDSRGMTTGQSQHNNGKTVGKGQKYQNWLDDHPDIILGYTDCGCNAGFEAGIVLDPFFGSGTVGIAAEKLGLRWCGIELNEEYIKMAKKRLSPYQNESGWMFD